MMRDPKKGALASRGDEDLFLQGPGPNSVGPNSESVRLAIDIRKMNNGSNAEANEWQTATEKLLASAKDDHRALKDSQERPPAPPPQTQTQNLSKTQH